MRTTRHVFTLAISLIALFAFSANASAATVTNGGFETGDLTGWTLVSAPSPGGSWDAVAGTQTPTSFLTMPAPPAGNFAAIADQSGPTGDAIYQDIALEPGGTHTLSFIHYFHSYASLASPDTLDPDVQGDNQQYRVDIMRPTAPALSVDPDDVLATIFKTSPGDATTLSPTAVSFDLSPFAGQTIRLRFAQADNRGQLNVGVDEVSIASVLPFVPPVVQVTPAPTVPVTPPAPPAPTDQVAPVLRRVALTRSTFRVTKRRASYVRKSTRASKRGDKIKRTRVGASFVFTLSEPSTVWFTIEQAHGKSWKKLRGSFASGRDSGKNWVFFTGHLANKPLKPGRYKLVARATDAAGNSSKVFAKRFKILRR